MHQAHPYSEGFEPCEVECYSGQRYGERPRFFSWQGVGYQVRQIEREWLEPGERHFLVSTEDERLFELCYREQEDRWWLMELVGA